MSTSRILPTDLTVNLSLRRNDAPQGADVLDVTERHVVSGDVSQEVKELFARGFRTARLDDPVVMDGSAGQATYALALVRELTGHGFAIDWTLHNVTARSWRLLSHLYPPTHLTGTDDEAALQEWCRTWRFDGLVHRHGPGFVEVRDHRFGAVRRHTVRGERYLDAIQALLPGAEPDAVSADVVRAYLAADLVTQVGDRLLWLPHRVYRWPLPSELG